ncbi:MAG: tRNA preQ1(34) S-adenosylmethionine ribosyltransferase-isomerase QueA [Spirochaetota bacterium]
MKTSDFSFNLPRELIAQRPLENRTDSRLLILDKTDSSICHKYVKNLPEILDRDSVIVFNNSKVIKSRIFGFSNTGGKVEFLLIEKIDGPFWKVIVSKAKKQKIGKLFLFPGNVTATVIDGSGIQKIVKFDTCITDEYLELYGHLPLPPYIKRPDTEEDAERYQTVFSGVKSSIAAPTAGLHFTPELLNTLRDCTMQLYFITLHVGLGTFLPIRSRIVEKHIMHEEEYEIPAETEAAISRAKQSGKKILAVGTTTVRALESAWEHGAVRSGKRKTSLFISPGYRFKVVDQLFTNFHTSRSTLLVLVSAFAGKDLIDRAYQAAIEKKYRFFSYGDAMLIK